MAMSLLKSSLQALYRMGDRDMIDDLLLHTSRSQVTQILDLMESDEPTCLFAVHTGVFDFAAINMPWLQKLRVRRKDVIGKNLGEVDLLHLGREDAFGLRGVCAQHADHETFTKVLTDLMPGSQSTPNAVSASSTVRTARIIAVSEADPASEDQVHQPYCAEAEISVFLSRMSESPVAFVVRLQHIEFIKSPDPAAEAVVSNQHQAASSSGDKPSGCMESKGKQHRLRPGIEHQDHPGQRISIELRKIGKSWSNLDLKEQAQVIRAALDTKELIIDPTSKYMERWDLIIFLAVVYIVFVTPVEIAFITPQLDFLFGINRVVDLLFIIDMVMQFYLMYQDDSPACRGRNIWVKDRKKIAKRYMTSWFLIDVISVLPFDIVGIIMENQVVSRMKTMRAIRLIRLVKLFRVIRSSRLVSRHLYLIDVRYAYISLAKLACLLITISHWVACLWGLAGVMAEESYGVGLGWIGKFRDDKVTNTWETPGELWVASMYMSIMTITSIGYGDITPQVWEEFIANLFCMALGAGTWAYVIGNACGILRELDPDHSEFHKTLDGLNQMMQARALPKELRRRARAYVWQNRHSQRFSSYKSLTEQLSPALQGEVSMAVGKKWLDMVWYLKDTDEPFKVELAKNLNMLSFAPKELIRHPQGPALMILERGVAARSGCVLALGAIWGHDMILDRDSLREVEVATALSHCSVYTLTRQTLNRVRESFPRGDRMLRRAAVKVTRHRVLRSAVEEFRQIMRRQRCEAARRTGGGLMQTSASKDFVDLAIFGSAEQHAHARCDFDDPGILEKQGADLFETIAQKCAARRTSLDQATVSTTTSAAQDQAEQHDTAVLEKIELLESKMDAILHAISGTHARPQGVSGFQASATTMASSSMASSSTSMAKPALRPTEL